MKKLIVVMILLTFLGCEGETNPAKKYRVISAVGTEYTDVEWVRDGWGWDQFRLPDGRLITLENTAVIEEI